MFRVCKSIPLKYTDDPITFFGESLTFDETDETLKVWLNPGTKEQRGVPITVKVFISMHTFTWMSEFSPKIELLDAPRPPVATESTAFDNTMYAIQDAPPIRPYTELSDEFRRQAPISFRHHDRDGHLGGKKAAAFIFMSLPKSVLGSEFECLNHHENLAEISTAMSVSEQVVRWLKQSSVFLGMGSNPLRFLGAARTIIEAFPPRILHSDPPADAKIYAEEVKDLHCQNWKAAHRATTQHTDDDMDVEHSQGFQAYKITWELFLQTFNGWLVREASDTLGFGVVYRPAGAATDSEHARFKDECTARLDALIFRGLPGKLLLKKWNSLFQVLLWFHLAFQCDVISMVYHAAFSHVNYTPTLQESDATALSFHTVQGATFRCFKGGVAKPDTRDLCTIMVIVVEPLNWLARWLTKSTSVARRVRQRSSGEPAPWSDLANPSFSPVVRILEYYSLLSAGEAPRLKLLLGRTASYAQWSRENPSLNSIFRRAVTTAMLWIFARGVALVSIAPLLWAIFPDQRVDVAYKTHILDYLFDAPLKDVDELFTERVRAHFDKFELGRYLFLHNGPWKSLLVGWSWGVQCTVVRVEFYHDRNRKRVSKKDVCVNLVTKALTQESARLLGLMAQALGLQRSSSAAGSRDAPRRVRRFM